MRRFEIRRERSTRDRDVLLLVLQHEHAGGLDTCLVAPIVREGELRHITRLRPRITIDGQAMLIVIDRLAAIDRGQIGAAVGTAYEVADQIESALDLLLKGF